MIAPLPVLIHAILVHLLHLQPDGGVGDDDGQLLFPFPLLLPHLLLPCGPWTANRVTPNQGYFLPLLISSYFSIQVQPSFTNLLVNRSIGVERDVTFTCSVKNLGRYRVGNI